MVACKMKTDSYISPCTKPKFKCFKYFTIRPDTPNLIQGKIGNKLELIGTGKNFLNRTSIAQALKPTIINRTG